MDMPDFKEILSKLSVFKNNIPLLMSVIIVLIAVILFIPSHLIKAKLTEEMQKKSITPAKRIDREIEETQSNNNSTALRAQQEDYAKDANNIALLAQQTTRRELLSYDVFHDPNKISSTVVFRQFGQHYRKAIDDLLIRIGAGDCPTDAQIQKGIEDSAVNSRLRRSRPGMMGMGMMGGMPGQPSLPTPGASRSRFSPMMGMGMGRSAYGGGGPYGGGAYGGPRAGSSRTTRGYLTRSMRIGELEAMVVEEICRERAGSISVYAYPADLSGYEFWNDYKLAVEPNQAIEDCWYFQLAYWVVEDIFDTISSVNADYESVLTAPVKQLKQMSFNMGLRRAGAAGSIFTGRRRRRGPSKRRDDVDRPAYVHSNDDGLAESCTGRFTTPESDVDVIHFNLTVVIDVKSIMKFLQALCSAKEHKFRGFAGNESEQAFKHNQITVLESKFMSTGNEPYSLYDYGDNPVVELDLICEYIFNKKGYDEIKPETVKQSIIAAAEAANNKGRRR